MRTTFFGSSRHPWVETFIMQHEFLFIFLESRFLNYSTSFLYRMIARNSNGFFFHFKELLADHRNFNRHEAFCDIFKPNYLLVAATSTAKTHKNLFIFNTLLNCVNVFFTEMHNCLLSTMSNHWTIFLNCQIFWFHSHFWLSGRPPYLSDKIASQAAHYTRHKAVFFLLFIINTIVLKLLKLYASISAFGACGLWVEQKGK